MNSSTLPAPPLASPVSGERVWPHVAMLIAILYVFVSYTRWKKKISQEGLKFHYKSFSGGGCVRRKENEANFVCLAKVFKYLNTMTPRFHRIMAIY